MALDHVLALAGISTVLLGTVLTLYGIFAAPGFLTYATFEAGNRDVPIRAAISQKYSRPVPPYSLEEVRLAQKDAELELAGRLMEVAEKVDAARGRDLRKTQRWATTGVLLLMLGSVLQGCAVLVSS
jgi:hypothetical protein